MNRVRYMVTLSLAAIAFVPCSNCFAQARASQVTASKEVERAVQTAGPAERARKIVELETWLQRLVGKFQGEGVAKVPTGTSSTCFEGGGICYRRASTQGTVDCAPVAADAGLHCVINIARPDFQLPYKPDFVGNWPGPFLDGAIVLFGIDPERMGIRFLLVDAKSIAYEAFGTPEGNVVTFRSECMPDPYSKNCRRRFWFQAKPDGSGIEMGLEKRLGTSSFTAGHQFTLRRQPQR